MASSIALAVCVLVAATVILRAVRRPDRLAARLGFGPHRAMIPVRWSSTPWFLANGGGRGRLDLYDGGAILTPVGPRWALRRAELVAVSHGHRPIERLVGPLTRLDTADGRSVELALTPEAHAIVARWFARSD